MKCEFLNMKRDPTSEYYFHILKNKKQKQTKTNKLTRAMSRANDILNVQSSLKSSFRKMSLKGIMYKDLKYWLVDLFIELVF